MIRSYYYNSHSDRWIAGHSPHGESREPDFFRNPLLGFHRQEGQGSERTLGADRWIHPNPWRPRGWLAAGTREQENGRAHSPTPMPKGKQRLE